MIIDEKELNGDPSRDRSSFSTWAEEHFKDDETMTWVRNVDLQSGRGFVALRMKDDPAHDFTILRVNDPGIRSRYAEMKFMDLEERLQQLESGD